MFQLKTLTPDAVPSALMKAVRYRLLNEPEQAESICRDILQIEPGHQEALRTLILALTDRLGSARPAPTEAIRELLVKLETAYDREYYAGLIAEREGIAWLRSDKPRAGSTAYHFLRAAMTHFEKAEPLQPAGTEDALLRWNSCARTIDANPDIKPADDALDVGSQLGD